MDDLNLRMITISFGICMKIAQGCFFFHMGTIYLKTLNPMTIYHIHVYIYIYIFTLYLSDFIVKAHMDIFDKYTQTTRCERSSFTPFSNYHIFAWKHTVTKWQVYPLFAKWSQRLPKVYTHSENIRQSILKI